MLKDPSRESVEPTASGRAASGQAASDRPSSGWPPSEMLGRREFLATSARLGLATGLAGGLATGLVGCSQTAQAARTCAPSVKTSAGPFYPEGEVPLTSDLVALPGHAKRATGQIIHVEGTVYDRTCRPLPGASVVIWQADTRGLYRHSEGGDQKALDPHFGYFARAITDDKGQYHFRTLVPASYRFAGLLRAPHIHVASTHGSGKARRELITEIYFSGKSHDDLRAKDQVFASRPAQSRHRLIAARKPASAALAKSDPGALMCRFDMRIS